ncbi:MAG: FISUMP domain-containing protein, partial [Bacteroidales bacterium]
GAAGMITGTAVLCQASTAIAYSTKDVSNAISYTWTLVPGTAGVITGNTASITIDWSAVFSGTASLTVKGVNSCGNGASSPAFPILVNPKPFISYIMCTDSITIPTARIIQLKGGIPLGGTYTGTGVNPATGTFNPAAAGIGAHIITYSYTNVNSCVNSASHIITVINPDLFICGGNLKDVRDNKLYNTVLIGTQCWMAESFNYGTAIVSTQDQFDNCTPEKYCYGDNPANCSNYGGFYQWDELMAYSVVSGSQGICPPGWHVPTEAEWTLLFSNYINNGFAGSALKATGYSGFDALIDGVNFFNRGYSFNNFAGFYWSSDSQGAYKAWAHAMNSFNSSVSFYPSSRSNAFSVRCIKD